jgi:hypothetical protein
MWSAWIASLVAPKDERVPLLLEQQQQQQQQHPSGRERSTLTMKLFGKRPAFLAPAPQRSKEELAFVRRLDIFLMTFGCISQGIFIDIQRHRHEVIQVMKLT